METRSDNLKKVPVASKLKKPNREAKLRKVAAPTLDRQAASVSRKKEIPQLTPLHRLQRFKAIRDKNLKSKGFKNSLENKIKKMEEVTTATTTTVEIKEKVSIKEIVEKVEISNTNGIEERTTIKETVEEVEVTPSSNGIEKSEEDVLKEIIKNGSSTENGHEESNSSPKEEHRRSVRLKEMKNEEMSAESAEELDVVETESEPPEISHESEPIEDNVESNIESEEANKVYSESLPESDAVSSISSQQAISNSTPGPTDDEEEVEIIESKPEYESDSKDNNMDTTKEEKDVPALNSCIYKEAPEPYNRGFSTSSSSYKSSCSNLSRIYGRRPVRHVIGSRKRKMEEESVKYYDCKRINSPSLPSPRWRFFPSSMNFWTPRTTPFVFSATTPVKSLNDSMTVNVDEETIRSHLDDSDLFSDADEFAPQPAKKSRWGCAIM